ncbi:MAG: glycosyltransferase [Phycisphaerales bacterium]
MVADEGHRRDVMGQWIGPTRMDMHCHSRASSKPLYRALGALRCPESFSEPERVFDQALARGMDLVTITDHDTIDGAMELVERGFPGVVVGEEVTTHFPEDGCRLHVLVWGLNAAQHEAIGQLGLRDDVYSFARWLFRENLAHALAHPLYSQNGRLTVDHLEKCALLFKGFELLNGAHTGAHRDALSMFLRSLTPASVTRLSKKHEIEALWPRAWVKAITAGSDDHALLNVGRTFTEVSQVGEEPTVKIEEPSEFLRLVMAGHGEAKGEGGHPSLLAHQLTAVAAQCYAREHHGRMSARVRYAGSKVAPYAGAIGAAPGKARIALREVARRVRRKKKCPSARPLINALRREVGPVLARHPEVARSLDPMTWVDGPPMAQHEAMASFADELSGAVARALAGGALQASGNTREIAAHLFSYITLMAARAPYIVSLFHQNRERLMLEQIRQTHGRAGEKALNRPLKVALFTDTLGDVNGVSRFIKNVAARAEATGRHLTVLTSTRFETPKTSNIRNFEPVFAAKMPKYEQLEWALPPALKMLREVDALQPDVIHVSTPGPVGCVGFVAAKMLRAPLVGVYHTDFPAYIEHLFDDHAYTAMTSWFMKAFYTPFSCLFTRSDEYAESLVKLGVQRDRLATLRAGIDTDAFHVKHEDRGVWARIECVDGARVQPNTIKAIYVGRVSVEKNLPMLAKVWKRVSERAASAGVPRGGLELIVVGDGPYRKQMQEELEGCAMPVRFLGFRHGQELSSIYASSDFFVFPSTTDTLGQVVMEAQSSGLPVIVTDVGGPKEVVDHDLTGFVLGATDERAWVDSILRLTTDAEKREGMGRSAHTRMARHSIEASFEHYWTQHERVREEWLERAWKKAEEGKRNGLNRVPTSSGVSTPSSPRDALERTS